MHLNYPIDREKLLAEAEIARQSSKPYTDNRYPDLYMEDWLIGHHNSEYITSIMNDFKVQGKPRFYWMLPNAIIPEHIDNNTLCSLNFVLTENAAPITIGSEDFYYKAILLNTVIPHSVKNNQYERIMLKISIFNESFNEVESRIKHYEQTTIG